MAQHDEHSILIDQKRFDTDPAYRSWVETRMANLIRGLAMGTVKLSPFFLAAVLLYQVASVGSK